jgi:protein CpxP
MLVGMAFAAAVVGMVAVGVGYAQQPPAPPNGGMAAGQCPQMGPGGRGQMMGPRGMRAAGPFAGARMFLGQLGLSDQQKTQVKGIFEDHKADMKKFQERMRPARQALNAAILGGADEATIRARAADVAAVQADMDVFHAQVRAQVLAVLTPEQQAKAKELQQQMQQRRAAWHKGQGF